MFIVAVIISFAADWFSKWLVSNHMQLGQSIPLIGDFFSLEYIVNSGASFSMLSGRRWLLIGITVLILLGVLWMLKRVPKDYLRLRLALGVFVGGALGNLFDRIISGQVVDFLHLYFKAFDYHFPTFNIADCCIDIGVFAVVLMLFFGREKKLLED